MCTYSKYHTFLFRKACSESCQIESDKGAESNRNVMVPAPAA
jgi:hypothetical protein